jgi:glycine betaine/choline ABC-type transport system substrate-binding protein
MKIVSALLAALILTSCAPHHGIIVASKNFTEQLILGEIAAQQLERKLHITVQRKLNLGGTLLAHEAMLHGDIDIYPEYTGTGASAVLRIKAPPRDPAEAYVAVRDAYLKRFNVVWLPPLGFNDSFAMVVRAADAGKLRKPALSAATGRAWRLGVGYEFVTRADGLAALDKAYGLKWQGTPSSMDLGLLYQALDQGKVDMAAGSSTDAQLTDAKYVALDDDKHAFPAYNACYLVRKETLDEYAGVSDALGMLQNRISDDTMRQLNRRVQAEHEAVEKVARDFLATQP